MMTTLERVAPMVRLSPRTSSKWFFYLSITEGLSTKWRLMLCAVLSLSLKYPGGRKRLVLDRILANGTGNMDCL
jgi:hypothetical protein